MNSLKQSPTRELQKGIVREIGCVVRLLQRN
jgi:hypothetical protein